MLVTKWTASLVNMSMLQCPLPKPSSPYKEVRFTLITGEALVSHDIAISPSRYPMTRYPISGLSAPRKSTTPPLIPSFAQTHLLDTPSKTSPKELHDTTVTNIVRYGKYRCWASEFIQRCSRLRLEGHRKCSTQSFSVRPEYVDTPATGQLQLLIGLPQCLLVEFADT